MIKRLLFICISLISSVHAQQLVGGEAVITDSTSQSVQKAVQTLGNEVLKSNFRFAVENMYPRWKLRQAKRLGSETKLLASFNKAGVQMQEAGITIDSFIARQPTTAYKVHPKMIQGSKEIRSSSDLHYELLVFVPTQMKMSFMLQNQPKRSFIRQSFQIAVAKEGSTNWTFIDGATIQVRDLRSMFPLLPQDLVLPEKSDTEIK